MRQNASTYLALVQQGEVVDVTVRGSIVARIVPVQEDELDRMVAEGQVRLPTTDSIEDIKPLELGGTLTQELLAAREHER